MGQWRHGARGIGRLVGASLTVVGLSGLSLWVAPSASAGTYGPLAALEADPSTGGAPLAVNFNGAQSYGNGGTIASWVVSFGDGTTDATGSGAPGSIIPHIYDSPGTYVATLTVTNRSGLTASATAIVTVLAGSSAIGGATGAVTIPVTGAKLTGITSSTLPVKPAFKSANTDYVWYCGSGTNDITVTLKSSGTISADGQSGSQINVPVSVVNNQAVVIQAPSGIQYWIRCLPSTFPHVYTTRNGNAENGYYLTGTFRAAPRGIPGYPIILNSFGTPVWYLNNLPFSGDNITLLPGSHTIAWSNHGPYSLYNLDTQTVSWMAPPIDPPDEHELFTDTQGNHWMISTPVLSGYNLTPIGYAAYHKIVDCVVQEMNPQGQVIWSWDASRYVSPYESNKLDYVENIQSTRAVDVYHCNSVDVDPEDSNDILISMREVGVFLVNKTTGSIIWKLGSTSYPPKDAEPVLSIVNDPEGTIQGQHDARFQPNGDISMFDDHTGLTGAARAIEYAINTTADTATMVWEYAAPSGKHSSRMGSVRRYDSSGAVYDEAGTSYTGPVETVIDWGQGAPTPGFTVVDNSGSVLLNADLQKGYVGNRGIFVPLSALNLTELRDTAGTNFP